METKELLDVGKELIKYLKDKKLSDEAIKKVLRLALMAIQ